MPLQFTLVNQSPVTCFSQSQTHAQSRSTIGQCLLYSLSHTAVSLVLYTVVRGLRGRNILHQLLLILLHICSRSVRPMSASCLLIRTLVVGTNMDTDSISALTLHCGCPALQVRQGPHPSHTHTHRQPDTQTDRQEDEESLKLQQRAFRNALGLVIQQTLVVVHTDSYYEQVSVC